MVRETILILDYGSQYTQLIARRVREHRIYCEIHPCTVEPGRLRRPEVRGVILSGGPASAYEPGAPQLQEAIWDLEVPVMGICYGMQLLALRAGGRLRRGERREYGRARLRVQRPEGIFKGFWEGEETTVWMSHGDLVEEVPPGAEALGSTENTPVAALRWRDRPFSGVQFHPEVVHTERGAEILANFLFGICGCRPTWTMGRFIEEATAAIREQVGEGRAIAALSGGVDSSVAATLLHRAIGERLVCLFVDTGLLREGEREGVTTTFAHHLRMPLRVVDAKDRFLAALKGVEDPEEKRRRIGHAFIRAFEEEARAAGPVEFLVQGTLYPDVIESQSVHGPSATIKTHHNVGGLPPDLAFRLIEPLRELFKDEVREVGRELGLPEEIVGRHPFPGPGLAVRILGEVTEERLVRLRAADRIFLEEIRRAGLYAEIWQAFAVLLPVRSVGVMGDFRTYANVVALRAVTSRDGMTADWYPFPSEVLSAAANRIINEVEGVNRVVYDVSSKPPSTIEWE